MADRRIGLVEFIDQIKLELLTEHVDTDQKTPLFIIDELQVEVSVGVTRGGDGSVSLYVLEVGGKIESEQTQKVCVTLTPVLDRETRIRMLDPKLTKAQREQIFWATVKSSGKESLKDLV